MKIVIVGCGKIGKVLVSSLASEGHDVIAIDNNQSIVNDISNRYDVIGVC